MGKQIRFFLLNTDEENLLKVVSDFGDIIVDNKAVPVAIDSLQNSNKLSVYIMSSESNVVKDKNNFIDAISSDVIQFSRCLIRNEKEVSYGRLWAEFKYYDDCGQKVEKSKWFNEKFLKYRKWITKNLILSKCKDFYIGEETFILYKNKEYKMMATPKLEVEF